MGTRVPHKNHGSYFTYLYKYNFILGVVLGDGPQFSLPEEKLSHLHLTQSHVHKLKQERTHLLNEGCSGNLPETCRFLLICLKIELIAVILIFNMEMHRVKIIGLSVRHLILI